MLERAPAQHADDLTMVERLATLRLEHLVRASPQGERLAVQLEHHDVANERRIRRRIGSITGLLARAQLLDLPRGLAGGSFEEGLLRPRRRDPGQLADVRER